MCRRHYAERARGPHHFISIAGAARLDEDFVWLKHSGKNHQPSTLAINISIIAIVSPVSMTQSHCHIVPADSQTDDNANLHFE